MNRNTKVRKCTCFCFPPDWENPGKFRIGFAYYKTDKWTGESENTELTEDELYALVKPALTKRREW